MRVLRAPYDTAVRWAGFLAALVSVGGLCVVAITAVHERRLAEARACAAELSALKARVPIVARLSPLPSDPCVAIQQLVAR